MVSITTRIYWRIFLLLTILGKAIFSVGLAHTDNVQIEKESLGGEQTNTDAATSLNNLGLVYFNQEEYDKALPLFEKALQIRQKLLGDEHPEVATSLSNLGSEPCSSSFILSLYSSRRRNVFPCLTVATVAI